MTVAEQDVAAIRLGYGRTPGSASVARLADLVAEVDRAPVRPPALADMASAPRIVQFATIRAALDKMNMESLNAFRMQRYDLLQGNYQRDAHARIAQAVSSPFGFVERLVQSSIPAHTNMSRSILATLYRWRRCQALRRARA